MLNKEMLNFNYLAENCSIEGKTITLFEFLILMTLIHRLL